MKFLGDKKIRGTPKPDFFYDLASLLYYIPLQNGLFLLQLSGAYARRGQRQQGRHELMSQTMISASAASPAGVFFILMFVSRQGA